MTRLTPSTAAILRIFRQATPDQYARGMAWYADAHTIALALDATNVARASGIMAALSPMMSWERNVILAARVYADGFASGALKNSTHAADRIYAGAAPLDVMRGQKVRAFFATILDPAGCTDVVIDRHAFDIALGQMTDDAARNALARKGVYASFAAAYVRAARTAGVSPSQMQAVTWIVWRETVTKFRQANARTAVAQTA